MKSVAEQLSEAFDALEQKGHGASVNKIRSNAGVSLENRLREAKELLASTNTSRKHNGAHDNGHVRESANADARVTTEKLALVKTLIESGLSEREARVIAGVGDNDARIAQMIECGVSTEYALRELVGCSEEYAVRTLTESGVSERDARRALRESQGR